MCEYLVPQCRQVTALCDDILRSTPEALLTQAAQLESVDLVPVSPGDKLVKPIFRAFDHFRSVQSHISFNLGIKEIIFFPVRIFETLQFFLHLSFRLYSSFTLTAASFFFKLSLNFHLCHLTGFL